MTDQIKIILSPFLIIATNVLVAITAGEFIGKWAFVPVMLTAWVLFAYFVKKYGKPDDFKKWLQPIKGKVGRKIAALFVALIPLPLLIFHYKLLAPFYVWLPWILIALINPFLEEFYWRGLLMDYTKHWAVWASVLFSSILFSMNHIAFGVNSGVVRGIDTLASTFIMGVIWAIVYHKTGSLRWTITAHILVDTFNVSSVAFLDLFEKQSF